MTSGQETTPQRSMHEASPRSSQASAALHPVRCAVVGNSGSGKSTLAQWIAQRFGAAYLDLDTVVWVPGETAVPRDPAEAQADVVSFCNKCNKCNKHAGWVIEGCYASLIGAALAHDPLLIFLNPGTQQCQDNCRSRPWEPHKFASREEQDQHLAFLLDWVAAYDTRDGDMSLTAHTELFNTYEGPKIMLREVPDLDQPPAKLIELLAG